MSADDNRRTAKRLLTRQRISDTATGLFMERGFDAVTVDQIAAASGVSRMTVFNHFTRKEDMLFDLDEVGRADLLAALKHKDPGVTPVEALRLFAHGAIAERRPYLLFCETGTDRFVQTIQGSDALMARARAIGDELADLLAGAFASAAGRKSPNINDTLSASMLVATWAVALVEGHRIYNRDRQEEAAYRAFLDVVDRGSKAVEVAWQQ